jgi:hypothetical protein
MSCSRIGIATIYSLATSFILTGCILHTDFHQHEINNYEGKDFIGDMCFLLGSCLFCMRSYIDLYQSIYSYRCGSKNNNDIYDFYSNYNTINNKNGQYSRI